MKFAIAGIDFLGSVFDGLIEAGWEPIKLFTRPCDGIYDFNETVVAQARQRRIPIQLSRIKPEDIAALHQAGLATLTHTPAPMGFLNEICGRPDNEKAMILLVVGRPAPGCRVPAIAKKPMEEIAIFL